MVTWPFHLKICKMHLLIFWMTCSRIINATKHILYIQNSHAIMDLCEWHNTKRIMLIEDWCGNLFSWKHNKTQLVIAVYMKHYSQSLSTLYLLQFCLLSLEWTLHSNSLTVTSTMCYLTNAIFLMLFCADTRWEENDICIDFDAWHPKGSKISSELCCTIRWPPVTCYFCVDVVVAVFCFHKHRIGRCRIGIVKIVKIYAHYDESLMLT